MDRNSLGFQLASDLAEILERGFDRGSKQVREMLGKPLTPMIAAYTGFGTPRECYLRGRVLDDNGIACPGEDASWVRNLAMTVRRAASHEIPHAELQADYAGTAFRVQTDDEGFFEFHFTSAAPRESNEQWGAVRIHLLHPLANNTAVAAEGRILFPPATARFAVISDLDDTVVRTDVTSLMKMARTLTLSNARTRVPFPGVAAFYRALQDGIGGHERNPIFYLSSSPWNLYDLLRDFLAHQQIPEGPLLLRDWGLGGADLLPLSHLDYKMASIRKILDLYPHLPFILIGDSGQQDPEIYLRAVQEYGRRILAVYIRSIRPDLVQRVEQVQTAFADAVPGGVSLKLVADTIEAARDAASHSWLPEAALGGIADEKDDEEQSDSFL